MIFTVSLFLFGLMFTLPFLDDGDTLGSYVMYISVVVPSLDASSTTTRGPVPPEHRRPASTSASPALGIGRGHYGDCEIGQCATTTSVPPRALSIGDRGTCERSRDDGGRGGKSWTGLAPSTTPCTKTISRGGPAFRGACPCVRREGGGGNCGGSGGARGPGPRSPYLEDARRGPRDSRER